MFATAVNGLALVEKPGVELCSWPEVRETAEQKPAA